MILQALTATWLGSGGGAEREPLLHCRGHCSPGYTHVLSLVLYESPLPALCVLLAAGDTSRQEDRGGHRQHVHLARSLERVSAAAPVDETGTSFCCLCLTARKQYFSVAILL
ncbi:hypothetical protein E2C01_059143 [Portunus trituberculatus]|uniref:Uncharacterized protein n=1 Tax=Portunus trituberculatus TaxID=210409 RepID=A0A5B7GYC8_PORTR|nr:hypothetical protein [Portunus trituberculatus]